MAKGDSVPGTYRQTSGLGHTPAYQVSGRPWMTGSAIAPSGTFTVEFPSVTKNFTVVNTRHSGGETEGSHAAQNTYTGSLVVYFGPTPTLDTGDPHGLDFVPFWNGTNIPQINNNHYVFLDETNDAYTFETKCTKVHITCLGYGDFAAGVPSQKTLVSGSVRIIAELTGIDKDDMYALEGSGIDD